MDRRMIRLDVRWRGIPLTLQLLETTEDIVTTNFNAPQCHSLDSFAPFTVDAGAGLDPALKIPQPCQQLGFSDRIAGVMRLEGRIAEVSNYHVPDLLKITPVQWLTREIGPTDCLRFDPSDDFEGVFRHDGRGNLKSQGPYKLRATRDMTDADHE